MSTRTSILALAAVATVAIAALASTAASANPVMGVIKKPVLGVPVKPPIFGVIIHPPITGVVIHHPDHDDDQPHFWWHNYHRAWMVEQSTPMPVSTPTSVRHAGHDRPTAVQLPDQELPHGWQRSVQGRLHEGTAMASPDELKADARRSA